MPFDKPSFSSLKSSLPNQQDLIYHAIDDPPRDANCLYRHAVLDENGMLIHPSFLSMEIEYSQVANDILRDADIPPSSQRLGAPHVLRVRDPCPVAPAGIANQLAYKHVEPSYEPCNDEIPWSELAFWLEDGSGLIECFCGTCITQHRNRASAVGAVPPTQKEASLPSGMYRTLSAKIPLIALPRIEGTN